MSVDSKGQKVMPTDYIIELAKEAGIETDWSFDFKIRLERFAAFVRADLLKELAEMANKNGNAVLAEQLRNYK